MAFVRRGAQGQMQIKVRVPEGCSAGDTLEVVAPSGDLIHVVIPAGHGPGALLCLDANELTRGPTEDGAGAESGARGRQAQSVCL